MLETRPLKSSIGIGAVLASALLKGCISTFVMAFFSMQMELAGVETRVIGLANSFQLAALVVVTLALPRLLYRTNLWHMQAVASLLGMAGIAGLAMLGDVIPAHLGFRFVLGCGLVASYITYEYWLNSAAPDHLRGRIMALYGTCVVIGMGVGPLLIPIIGTNGIWPYAIGIGLFAASFFPVFLARRYAPKVHEEAPAAGLFGMIRKSPTIAVIGLMYGVLESGMMGFMPIYGLREGLSEADSAVMLSLIFWGGVALQLPVGWFADTFSARTTLLSVTFIGLAGGIALPLLIGLGAGLPLWAHMTIWGGIVTTIYTIATILIGAEHKGPDLANATLAFVMMYGIGSMFGPTITSEALERIGTEGLPWLMALACGITFGFTAWRTWRKQHG